MSVGDSQLREMLARCQSENARLLRERDEARGKAAYMVEAFWLAIADLGHSDECPRSTANATEECMCWRTAADKVLEVGAGANLCEQLRDLEDERDVLRQDCADLGGREAVFVEALRRIQSAGWREVNIGWTAWRAEIGSYDRALVNAALEKTGDAAKAMLEVVDAARVLRGHEATACLVDPACGNCAACRFNAALERLDAVRGGR